ANIALALETIENKYSSINGNGINGHINGSAKTSLADYLRIIGSENDRMDENVEKILQISVMEREKPRLRYEKVDLHELISNVCRNFELQVQAHGGAFIFNRNGHSVVIDGDEIHLANVIYNLVDNAIKYNHHSPVILISIKDKGDTAEIVMEDNGTGIDKKNLDRIFDRFYRVPTGNLHDVKGFGLGLAYVQKIVQAHGGQISVSSEVSKGTIFKITLPKMEMKYEHKSKHIAGRG
ncbi:MAG: HAMP domain-containing histidine kinase, partial [Bacteroidota bacterium]|nr:HAMP domain-containing histidine kinase [Bacteroidota bacterium]